MEFVLRYLRKLKILLFRGQFHRELEEEMIFHREQVQKDLQGDIASSDTASSAAYRQFGNQTRLKEQCHEVVVFRFETVAQDVRYAVRQLLATPSFSLVIVLTLALSIGANTAIFSVIQGVLLKSLPFLEPEHLVRIFLNSAEFPKFPLNPFDFRDVRDRNHSFESMAAFTRRDLQLSGVGETARLYGISVTAEYFHVLGLRPELGREFDRRAEIEGNGSQVILSDRLWRTRFAAAPDILGRKITLDSLPFTVVGVMPAGAEHPGNSYHSLPYGEAIDVWSPFTFGGDPSQRGSHYLDGIARLKNGVTLTQANAEMDALMAQLEREHGGGDPWRVTLIPLYQEIVGADRRILLVLLGAVAMVLLIACANAANLLLARAAKRQREIAVRLALGAPRRRLIRQLLTESLLLSLLGGALGVAMALGGVKALVSLLPADFPRAHDIQVNLPVFAFTFLVSIATGILFGLAPALRASRTDPTQSLHESGRGATASGRQHRLRNALVISEVSLACILLIGAGLLFRSLINLIRTDPGFQQEHVLTASLSLPREKYKGDDAAATFYDHLVTALEPMPGVQSVAVGSDVPWTGYNENLGGFSIEGKQPPPHQEFHARYHMATPDYFRALGIPLLRGRFFTKADKKDAPKVLIINQAMADLYWPHEDVVGKRLTFSDKPKEKDWVTVVGIVGSIKDQPNSPGATPAFWWPELQQPYPDMSLVVRADGDPQALVNTVRSEVAKLDPALAVADIRLMNQIAGTSVATQKLVFVLVGLFAALAIILAMIGTYGVISYSVTQRRAEFGLRIALGAQRSDVLRLVLSQAAALVLAGTFVGLIVALTLSRVLRNLIYDVSAADPLTFASVAIIVIFVAIAACYIPARRATQSDPMNALRAE
jgi:predicted permease